MKVSFDLKNNSFCEFYKNDLPNSIKKRPEMSKNSSRNLKKKIRKKFKSEIQEFVEKLSILSSQEQRKEIKDFVYSRNLSKEDSAALTLNILHRLDEFKKLTRKDSKIDINLEDSQLDSDANFKVSKSQDVIAEADEIENTVAEECPPLVVDVPRSDDQPKDDIKFDFYQTLNEFVVVFYIKDVESCVLHFIDSRRVIVQTRKRDMELEFDKDLKREGNFKICAFNLKIGLKKLNGENVYFKITRNVAKDSSLEVDKVVEENHQNEVKLIELKEPSSMRKSLEVGNLGLLPHYMKNNFLKELGHDLNPIDYVCGLFNPGIDCYIITIIQCLFSIKSFTNLLARGSFVSEINFNNPLSTSKGQMAVCFASVLARMLDQNKPFALTSLKRSIAKFWGLFDPYQQQDAEEILNFFLDTLHEELNNAPRTRYTPREDLPDMELANEYYKSHSLLNQSVIADTFQGFYKSKLSCPKCGHESRKFDPFMNLSIEVPAPPTLIDVLVIDSILDLSKRRISVPVKESFFMKEIYNNILARFDHKDDVDIIGAVIQNLKITHIVDKEKPLSHYSDSIDNIAYYLVSKNMPYVLVEHSVAASDSSQFESFGIPFVTSLGIGECDVKQIRTQIMSILTKSIVKSPLNAVDLFDVVCNTEDEDQNAFYDLQPNSIIQIMLIWKSIKIKEFYYKEENDFYVISEKELHHPKHFTLDDCLEHFFKEETIEWRCEKCKNNVEAIKKLDLWSSPEILIIHLKRFAFNLKYQKWIKHNTLIDYPVSDFDLSSFRIGPEQCDIYDLVAVSNHMGSMDRGHYTAFGHRGSKWYHFDDDVVSEVKKEELVSPSGYILFYQRKCNNL